MNMSSVHDVAKRTISSGAPRRASRRRPSRPARRLRRRAPRSARSKNAWCPARLVSRNGSAMAGFAPERNGCHLRHGAGAVLRIASERRHPQRAAPRQRRDVAHDRRGRDSGRPACARSPSGGRACRAVRARCSGDGDGVGRPSSNSRTARDDLARRAAHLQGRDRRQAADGAPTPSAPASESCAATTLPGTRARRQGVGAPLERGAVAHLDHEVGPQHRAPSATGSALPGIRPRRSSPSPGGIRWAGGAAGSAGAARQPGRSGRPARTAPRQPASAGDCERRCRRGATPSARRARPARPRRAVEPADEHDPPLGGNRR